MATTSTSNTNNGISHTQTIQQGTSSMKTFQDATLTDYALFMGGTNVTHDVLEKYDPLKTGYGRLFMIRTPAFVDKLIPTQMGILKHILEYGNTSVQGIGDVSVNFDSIKGGYSGKSFELPTAVDDGTTAFTVKVYEFSGSPVREVLHTWINGTIDLLTGLATYHGVDLEKKQSNQTAEFIYVATDNTGEKVEYACLLANCFPKGLNTDVFNYDSGTHALVETDIEFTCTKYESIQINKVACDLIDKYKMLANSLNFHSGYTVDTSVSKGYDITDGKIKDGITADTNSVVVH
jgi:hypothetical protein